MQRHPREVGSHRGGHRRGDRRAGVSRDGRRSRRRRVSRDRASSPIARRTRPKRVRAPRSRAARARRARDRRARRGSAIRRGRCERLLSSPTIASKRGSYRQYDRTVRTNTVVGPGGDAAVVRMCAARSSALALKTDCNGRYVYLDPRVGGTDRGRRGRAQRRVHRRAADGDHEQPQLREPETARGVSSSSARRSPAWGRRARRSARRSPAATSRSTTRTPRGAVYPTPVDRAWSASSNRSTTSTRSHVQRRRATRSCCSVRTRRSSAAASTCARSTASWPGAPPACDLAAERALIEALLEAISDGTVRSAHDCSDGGLAVALAECCDDGPRRAASAPTVDLTRWSALPRRALLFGEAQGRVVVSTPRPDAVLAIAQRHGVPGDARSARCGDIGAPFAMPIGPARIDAASTALADGVSRGHSGAS